MGEDLIQLGVRRPLHLDTGRPLRAAQPRLRLTTGQQAACDMMGRTVASDSPKVGSGYLKKQTFVLIYFKDIYWGILTLICKNKFVLTEVNGYFKKQTFVLIYFKNNYWGILNLACKNKFIPIEVNGYFKKHENKYLLYLFQESTGGYFKSVF